MAANPPSTHSYLRSEPSTILTDSHHENYAEDNTLPPISEESSGGNGKSELRKQYLIPGAMQDDPIQTPVLRIRDGILNPLNRYLRPGAVQGNPTQTPVTRIGDEIPELLNRYLLPGAVQDNPIRTPVTRIWDGIPELLKQRCMAGAVEFQ